ncbi:Agamous-like MADS-box protein AGL62 [Linum perenne]
MERINKGRQRVEMVKMMKDSNRQVTFSKRRSGLFKKASELCTLCGVDIAIIVFSPGQKVFSFGHPSIQAIVDRFLAKNPSKPCSSTTTSPFEQIYEAHRNAQVCEYNAHLTEIEKKYGEKLNQMRKLSQSQCWWEAPIEELGLDQLRDLKTSLQELKKHISRQSNWLKNSTPPPLHFLGPTHTTTKLDQFYDIKLNSDLMMPHSRR